MPDSIRFYKWILVSKYFALTKFFRKFRKVWAPMLLNYAGRYDKDAPKGHIIINLSTILPLIGVAFESTMALALNRHGYKSLVLLDDGFTCHNETKAKPYVHSYAEIRLMNRMMRKLASKLPFVLCYSELFSPQEKTEMRSTALRMADSGDFTLDGMDLSAFIRSSLVKYYASVDGIVSIANSEPNIVRRYTCNAVISLRVAQKTEARFNPVAYVNSHGIYSTWGPFYNYLKSIGKTPVIYDFGFFKENGFLFSRKGLTAEGNDDGYFREFGAGIDLEKARAVADEVMQARGSGQAADIERMGGRKGFDSQLPEGFLEKIKGKKVFGMFPNVMWDASITEQRSVFGDAGTWLRQVVARFKDSTDEVLVIRAHPGERPGLITLFGVKDLIDQAMGEKDWISDSIIYIPSDSALRSYSLFPYLSAGLVFNGTIGLELAYHGIPVLTAGVAPYSGTGFIAGFRDTKEYFEALSDPEKILDLQEQNRDTLLRFIYLYFDLREVPLRFNHPDYRKHWPEPATLDAILDDPNLDYICRAIVDQTLPFAAWKS